MEQRSTFEEISCVDKHLSGAIIQITEVMEKLADRMYTTKNKEFLKLIVALAEVRHSLNELYYLLPSIYYYNSKDELISNILKMLHTVRTQRIKVMAVARKALSLPSSSSISESALWQEIRDLKGDLWLIEKHLSDDIQKLLGSKEEGGEEK